LGNDPKSRKVHWVDSSKLCDKKEDRGLGLRDLEAFNGTLLAKQIWRLTHDKALVACLLKAHYYPNFNVLEAELGKNPSFTWHSFRELEILFSIGLKH